MEEWIKKSDAIKEMALMLEDISTDLCEDIPTRFGYDTPQELATEAMSVIPSADRPRGELKYMGTYYKCSVCGSEFMDEITFMGELNYCPACGADMRGESDEMLKESEWFKSKKERSRR